MVTEGRPEEWLNRIEDAMFATTKKHLYKVLEESKGKVELCVFCECMFVLGKWRDVCVCV